jgi:hypothetical protein
MAFVKVVEVSEIYHFPIHHLVHFYTIFWSYTCSNRGTRQLSASRAAPRRRAPRLGPPATLGFRAPARAFPRHRTFPGARTPQRLEAHPPPRVRRRLRRSLPAGPLPVLLLCAVPRRVPHPGVAQLAGLAYLRSLFFLTHAPAPSRRPRFRHGPPWPPPRDTCLYPPLRSTDPTDAPSRIHRSSSNHLSPHFAPPLAGR